VAETQCKPEEGRGKQGHRRRTRGGPGEWNLAQHRRLSMSVLSLSRRPQADGAFGWCPRCRNNDGYVSVYQDQWCVCHRHRAKWRIGSNLFSSWRDLSGTEHLQNAYRLATYAEVAPVFPTRIKREWLTAKREREGRHIALKKQMDVWGLGDIQVRNTSIEIAAGHYVQVCLVVSEDGRPVLVRGDEFDGDWSSDDIVVDADGRLVIDQCRSAEDQPSF